MRVFQIIILLLLTGCLQAQDVQFTAEASPNVLKVGEQFNLTYTCNQDPEGINLPEIRDFDLLGGPSQGHSQSVYSVNGKITTSSTYQYTYFFRASKEGKFTITPATIKIKNKVYHSNPITLEVLKASAQTSPQNQGAVNNVSSGDNNSGSGQLNDNTLFIRLILDKKEAYLGEQIMATVKIYTKTSLSGIDQGFKGPDFTGFFTEPIETPPLRNLQQEAVDGEVFGTGVIKRIVIIPQKTGELTIEPFDLDVAVRREVRHKYSDPFFDDFAFPDVQEIPVKLRSKPVTVTVKPLPPNAPSSFKGAVGNFRISSSLSNNSTATNEPITLKVTVTGRGNLKLINEVAVNVPYDMDRYDPVINTHMDNPLSGYKTFEYLIMPKVAGDFTIPPVEFTYFDADARQYKTLKTQPYNIHVNKGQDDTLMTSLPGLNKEDVRLLNQDIQFIKTRPAKLRHMNAFMAFSVVYYLLIAATLALFVIIIALRKRMIRQNADIAGLRLRKADKYARKRLKKSEVLLKQGNNAAFYEEMLGALWGYLGNKLNIPVASLSKDSARSALISRSIDQDMIDRLFGITDLCEMAQYGQGSGDIAREQLYEDALRIITDLQQKLK